MELPEEFSYWRWQGVAGAGPILPGSTEAESLATLSHEYVICPRAPSTLLDDLRRCDRVPGRSSHTF